MNDELYHYGVLGMKWGVRRYQNKDGTLTSAGKKHRSNKNSNTTDMSTDELRREVNRMNLEKRYTELTKSPGNNVSKATSGINKVTKSANDINSIYKSSKGKNDPYGKVAGNAINVVSNSSNLVKKVNDKVTDKAHTKRTKIKLEQMTDTDLQKAVERLDLERQYSNLKKETISKGQIQVSDVLDIAGTVLSIGASSVALAVGIKKLMAG